MRSLRAVAASLVLLVVPAICQAGTISFQGGSEQQALALLNQIRQQHHLGALTLSAPLRNAARAHSADMLQNSYFDHSTPDESFDARISRYVNSTVTAENIAWGVGPSGSAVAIVSQWMRSPGHRAVILTPGIRRIGLGFAIGTFGTTRNAVMATADFAA